VLWLLDHRKHLLKEETRRWVARCKGALRMEIIQGRMTVAQGNRIDDLPTSEINDWICLGSGPIECRLIAQVERLEIAGQ
jgi:hypothetical protein